MSFDKIIPKQYTNAHVESITYHLLQGLVVLKRPANNGKSCTKVQINIFLEVLNDKLH